MACNHFSTSVASDVSYPARLLCNIKCETLFVDDEQWVEQLNQSLFGNKPIEEITLQDMKEKIQEMQAKEPDCTHWTFGQ